MGDKMILRKIKGYIGILRPWFWLPALCPGIAGAIAAKGELPSIEILLLISFIFGPGIPGAAEALNDFFDRKYDVLAEIKKGLGIPSSGGSGIIQRGWISTKETISLSLLLFLLTLVMALKVSFILFFMLSIGILIAITYSAPPVRWKNRGIWGCIVQGFAYGFITFNTGWYLSSGRFGLYPAFIGLLLGILIIGYGSTADLADFKSDKKNNIKTLPVIWGERRASIFYVALMLIPYIVYLLICKAGILSINIMLFLILVIPTGYIAYQTITDYSPKNISKVHMIGVVLESIAPFLFVRINLWG